MTTTPREEPGQEREEPVAYSAPEYRLAGFTISGENAIECSECGAVLKESSAFLHSHWHERLKNLKVAY